MIHNLCYQNTTIIQQNDIHFYVKNSALILLNSMLIAISARIVIPLPWVSITLQSFMITLIGLQCSRRIAISSILLYLLEGLLHLPVFANGAFGLVYLLGPSGGYLIGYIPMLYIITAHNKIPHYPKCLLVCLGSLIMYLIGLIQLSFFLPLSMLWSIGLYNFIVTDILKYLAALTISRILQNKP